MTAACIFTCPGWPPPPYGERCGQTFEVRVGQRVEDAELGPFVVGETDFAEMVDDEILCRECALARLAEASACL